MDKIRIPIHWEAEMKEYHFFNETVFRGSQVFSNEKHNNTLNIKQHYLINKTQRKIKFSFIAEMHPYVGEIAFDGDCILESPDQNKIEILLKGSRGFQKRVEYTIMKNCYMYAEKIAKDNNIRFLPAAEVINELRESLFNSKNHQNID